MQTKVFLFRRNKAVWLNDPSQNPGTLIAQNDAPDCSLVVCTQKDDAPSPVLDPGAVGTQPSLWLCCLSCVKL